MYVSVCESGYNSLSICPIRSSIRLSGQTDGHTKTIHTSVACPSAHPSIIHPSPLTAISPRRHSKHVNCSLRWWGSGHPALADARNDIKVKLNQRSWLSWNHIFASILKCAPSDKPDGLQSIIFVCLFFITPPLAGCGPYSFRVVCTCVQSNICTFMILLD